MIDLSHVKLGVAVIATMMACAHAQPPAPAPTVPKKTRLAVLPAESDVYPKAATAIASSLSQAKLPGIDETHVSKVSLEVVQLSIECVDPTEACYEAVGKSLAANRLLFAQLAAGAKKKQLKVTVTLFDVDAQATTKIAEKVFPNEDEATAGIPKLVAEATEP